jgi:hypothetical protein
MDVTTCPVRERRKIGEGDESAHGQGTNTLDTDHEKERE